MRQESLRKGLERGEPVRALILTDRDRLAESVERYLFYRYSIKAKIIVIPRPGLSGPSILSLFENIYHEIELALEGYFQDSCSAGFPVFLDFLSLTSSHDALSRLNPVLGDDEIALAAMLILAFPEVHWIFIPSNPPNRNTNTDALLESVHFLNIDSDAGDGAPIKWHLNNYCPLFDGAGLRNRIKSNIEVELSYGIPTREYSSAAIDEETPYAFMNSYLLFRKGYRSHAVTRRAYMMGLFGDRRDVDTAKIRVTIEDMYLNFADKTEDEHFSDFSIRDSRYFPGLGQVANRIIMTVGHGVSKDPDKIERNRRFLESQRIRSKFIFKPLSGIFDIADKAKLKTADKFEWPPPKKVKDGDVHSAPGRLLLIAEKLLARAEKILKSGVLIEDSISGAVLALEAQELLGDKTPTTSFQALALKNQLEVFAECQFYGIEYNFDVRKRFRELAKEVSAVAKWFKAARRRAIELNSLIAIINDLALVFRNFSQFDEEMGCLNEIRRLRAKLNLERNGFLYWPIYLVSRYIEIMIGSLGTFLAVIFIWPVLFALGYAARMSPAVNSFPNSLFDSFATFFSLNPPDFFLKCQTPPEVNILIVLEILAGFIHLGIFIAYIYTRISRR